MDEHVAKMMTETCTLAMQQFEAHGCYTRALIADVTNEAALTNAFGTLYGKGRGTEREMPPLRGIFHCAGAVDDGILLRLDPQSPRVNKVLSPKVRGAWLLHTERAPLAQ